MEPASLQSIAATPPLNPSSFNTKVQTNSISKESFPGCFEDDFPFDKILAKLIQLNVLDRQGKLDRIEYFPTPPLAQAQIDELYKFYSQTVPCFTGFHEKQREAARVYFTSSSRLAKAKQESSEEDLQTFLSSTLLRSKSKDIHYFICPGELIRDLYNVSLLSLFQSGILNPSISLEIIGGHARQILHQAAPETKSWAETFFEIIVKHPLREIVPAPIIERFKQSPFDSDNRWLIPQANLDLLDDLRCRVAEFIAKQITAQYPEYQNERLFPYLIEFVKQFGLEKFMLVNATGNTFSLTNFGQKSYKNFEFIFVRELARARMFTLDAFTLSLNPFIEFDYTNFFRGLKPSSGLKDAQCLIDQYTYLLDCPDPYSAGPFVFFGGLLHQCKGARYPNSDHESILLHKVLSLCESMTNTTQESTRHTKKYDASLTVEIFANHMQKYLKNHAKNEINAYITFILRTLILLQRHEKDIPANVARLLWNKLAAHLKNCKSSQAKLFFTIATALDELKGEFSILYPFLQLFTFIFLSHAKSSRSPFKAYVTTNSGKTHFQLESEYILLIPCELNEAISLLQRKVNEKSDQVLGRLLSLMQPHYILEFGAETPAKNHFNRLGSDLQALETAGTLFLKSEFSTLKKLGVDLLFSCYSLSENTRLVPLILEALPSLLTEEKQRPSQELLVKQCEHLLQHARWIPSGYTLSLTRAHIAEFHKQCKSKFEFLPVTCLATDLIHTGYPQLETTGWKLWNELQPTLLKAKRKASCIQFVRTFPSRTPLAVNAFKLLINASVLSESETFSLLELILKSRANNPANLLILYAICKDVITKFRPSSLSEPACADSLELPRLIGDLLHADLLEESVELANLCLQFLGVPKNTTAFMNVWIRICKLYLALPEKLDDAIELFEKGQRLALFDPRTTLTTIVELQIEIVRRLIARGAERTEKKLLYYIASLAEKELDLETKTLLRNLIWTRFFHVSGEPDWQIIERETKRYHTFFDKESLMDFKMEALRKSVAKSSSPLTSMPLVRQILVEFNEESACIDVLAQLILNLCRAVPAAKTVEEHLDEAVFLLKHAKIKKNFPANLWQTCTIAYIAATINGSKKHQVNGQALVVQLLESTYVGDNSEEALHLIQFILSQVGDITSSASSFSRELERNFDSVLTWSDSSGSALASLQLFHHLLNLKLTVSINEKRIFILHKAFMHAVEKTPDRVIEYERLIASLKWFTKSELFPREQLTLYCSLMNALMTANSTSSLLRWLRRLLNYFSESLEATSILAWIQGLRLESGHLAEARELFTILKSTQSIERKMQSRLLFALLEVLDKSGCPHLDPLLVHSSALLTEYRESPLLQKRISCLMHEPTSDSVDSTFELITAYGLFRYDLCTSIFEKLIETPSLTPLAKICSHWPSIQASLDESLRHRFWRTMLERELTPTSSLLITVLDTLSHESSAFVSTLLPEIIAINLKDFPRQHRLLESISTLTHKAETPLGVLGKQLILTLDLSLELQLNLAYKCFSANRWEWEEIPVILSPFVRNSKKLSDPQLTCIEASLTSFLQARLEFHPAFIDLFRYLLIHHESFGFEILQSSLRYIRDYDPNAKESLQQTIIFAEQTGRYYLALRILKDIGSVFSPEDRLRYIETSAKSLLFSEGSPCPSQIDLANEMMTREIAECPSTEVKRSITASYVPYMFLPVGHLSSPFYAHERLIRLQESFFNLSLLEKIPKRTFTADTEEMRTEEMLHHYCSLVRTIEDSDLFLGNSPFYPPEARATLMHACLEDEENYFNFHCMIVDHILKCSYNDHIKNYNLLQLAKQLLYCLLSMGKQLSNYRAKLEDMLLKFMFWGTLSTSILFQQHQDLLKSIIEFMDQNEIGIDTAFLSIYTGLAKPARKGDVPCSSTQIMAFFRKIQNLFTVDDPNEPQFFCFGVHALDLFLFCQRLPEITFSQEETREIISLITMNTVRAPFILIKKEDNQTFISRIINASDPSIPKTLYFSTLIQLFMKTACSKDTNPRFFGSCSASKSTKQSNTPQTFGRQHLFLECLSLISTVSKAPFLSTSVSREICNAILFIITNLKSLENIQSQINIFMDLATPFFKHFETLHLEKDRVVELLESFNVVDLFNWEKQGLEVTPAAHTSRTSYLLIWLKCFINYYDNLPIEKFVIFASPHVTPSDPLYKAATNHLGLPTGALAAKQEFYLQLERIAEFLCQISTLKEINFASPAKSIEYVRKHIHKRKTEQTAKIATYDPDNFKIGLYEHKGYGGDKKTTTIEEAIT